MNKTKIHRMSGPVVVIGYILLIPSILGMGFSALGMLGAFFAGTAAVSEMKIPEDTLKELQDKKVPETVIGMLRRGEKVSEQQLGALTEDQKRSVQTVISVSEMGKAGAAAGSALGVGMFVCMGISAFTGGLFGWLLIMKKWVLKCVSCCATVDAS